MTVRIVAWNCARGLHRKIDFLLSLRPDIAIVSEGAKPEIVQSKAKSFMFSDGLWVGSNKDIGLAVYSFNELKLRQHHSWDKNLSFFLPVEVWGSAQFNLLAVHALSHHTPPKAVTNSQTTARALNHYRQFLTERTSVVGGDFNASVLWDKQTPKSPFAAVNQQLAGIGLSSVYHTLLSESIFGHEAESTLIWKGQGFHVDYLYAPNKLVKRDSAPCLRKFDGQTLSDHFPLVVELDL
jgi:hypothetical protein